MDKIEKRASTQRSRREFAKVVGTALAGSAMLHGSKVSARPEAAEIDTLAKLATQGTPAHLADVELTDLKKGIEDGLRNQAKIRDFKLPAEVEPAFVFRAKVQQ